MRKQMLRFVLFIFSCLACGHAMAQDVLVATLQHGEEMSAFYGSTGLQKAMGAAQDGDVITLSAGTFLATTIDKAVTLQGAGYVQDLANNRYRTVIDGNFNISLPEGSEGLFVEGIWHGGTITSTTPITGLTMQRCRISSFKFSAQSTNCLINHCRVSNVFYPDASAQNLCFKNSIIYTIKNSGSESSVLIDHCVLHNAYGTTAIFKNSILTNVYSDIKSQSAFYNNVYFAKFSIPGGAVNEKNTEIGSSIKMKALFSPEISYDGYSDTNPYTLTEANAAKYLGTDGTQVGIYGGDTPFTDVPGNPQVTQKEIATRTDNEGRLAVKITVQAQQ